MSGTLTKRIGVVIGVSALTGTLLIAGGPALAATTKHATTQATHPAARPAVTNITGTRILYLNYGSGFSQSGTMTISSDGTWSESDFGDAGFWTITGKDAILVNTADETVYFAKINAHGLGTKKKPGGETERGQNAPALTFYTLG
jgi:hypothetical protein